MTTLPQTPRAHATPPRDADALWRDLTNAIQGEIRLSRLDRMLYATDASIYQVEPRAVLIPADADDAARALAWAASNTVPVLPRGGGTSLAGQCVAEALVIDISASCDAMLSLDTASRRCRVEPGMTIDRLNTLLAPSGLLFAPDPSTVRQATIGGCIGNNAAGARSVRFGRTSDNVLGVDIALSDGRRARLDEGAAARDPVAGELTAGVTAIVRRHADAIRQRFPKTLRRSAGYQLDVILAQLEASGWDESRVNLAPLLCGSEGTLAMTLGAELSLVALAQDEALAVIAYERLDDAIRAVESLLALDPTAVELLDDVIIGLARTNPEQRRHVEKLPAPRTGPPEAFLFVEFQGTPAEVADGLKECAAIAGSAPTAVYTDAAQIRSAWALRRAGEPLLHAVPGARKPLGFVEDNAVPVEHLGDFVHGARAIFDREGTSASFYAHASVGVLHLRPMLDLRDPADEQRMHRIAADIADLARSLGGVMSGEHGDGRARGPLLDDYFGPEIMDAFRAVKDLFDPAGVLNPGNIVSPKPIESISGPTRVRAAGTAHAADARTFFDFTPQGGLTHAAELCNGAGVCRSTTSGSMCPAYKATRDERTSTRGWGNALRLAITGQLTDDPGPDWDHADTRASLHSCLSCKACKSECPTSVDVAQLKAEYTARSNLAAGVSPRQARFFGGFDDKLPLLSPFRALANTVSSLPVTRSFMRARYGIDPRRSLPKLVRPLHKRWVHRDTLPDTAPTVVLVADAFTTHFEPDVGLAARRAFEAFGYRVELFLCGDLARASISVGMLGRAIAEIDDWMERLRPFIDHRPDVAGFIVCEPSCLSAIADEWIALKGRTPIALRQTLADRSYLPEQFIDRHWDEHPVRPAFKPIAGRAVVHTHCHQRALWGGASAIRPLARILGDERVLAPETTCCGMAGSFGYTADRYDLSMKIAELSVVSTAKLAGEGDELIAAGTSCRHQILDTTGKRARHPIELIADLLAEA